MLLFVECILVVSPLTTGLGDESRLLLWINLLLVPTCQLKLRNRRTMNHFLNAACHDLFHPQNHPSEPFSGGEQEFLQYNEERSLSKLTGSLSSWVVG
jgi:hypothetical protein